ncbi:MAG TPA: hypothetical protein VEU74_12075 [Gemmatimonadales bacterium]|nr:hypothetical protein [Gemmatimonadales bacterium]
MAVTDKKVHFLAAFARDPIDFNAAAVAINQAGVVIEALIPWQGILPPYAMKGWQVENVQVFCTATAATASVDIQIARSIAAGALTGGASVLTGVITPVAGSIVQGALVAPASRRSITLNDVLAMLVTTNGTGTITNLTATVTIRPFPLDNEAS